MPPKKLYFYINAPGFNRKITVYGNFHENLRKNFLTHFVNHNLTNRGKNEDEDEKIWKNEFDFRILHTKISL